MDDVRPPTLLGRLSRAAHGISFQLMAVLSLAVLPIAAIAVWHSVVFSQESRRTAEILLLGLTEERVTLEHRLIEAGLQINPKQIASASLLASGGAACIQNLASFVFQHPIFQSAAFVPAGGISLCASDGLMRDLRSDAAHLQFLETPAPHVDRVPFVNGAMASILRVLQPVYENGAFIGYLSLVLQAFPLPFVQKPSGLSGPKEVLLFNADGTALTSSLDFQTAADRLPSKAKADLLLRGPDGFVQQTDISGTNSGFVKVTQIPGVIFAVGIWPKDNPISQSNNAWSRAFAAPLLIWLISMGTTLFAARRLVIRPIKMLRDEMRRFALGQRNAAIMLAPGAALEIQDTVNTFNKLELLVTRNEAALALTAEGKLLLLREVHHRIKNNLQMISSIISIQRRKTANLEVGQVLRSLQDRVLSIAAIDQSLYTNGDISDVRADLLVESITQRLIGVNLEQGHGVQIATQFETVMLNVDQIGPLSLLANEAVTNALKYVGKPEGGPPEISISLTKHGDFVHFDVVNTTGAGVRGDSVSHESTQLGMILVRAFSDQLAAVCHSGMDAATLRFHLSIKFQPSSLEAV